MRELAARIVDGDLAHAALCAGHRDEERELAARTAKDRIRLEELLNEGDHVVARGVRFARELARPAGHRAVNREAVLRHGEILDMLGLGVRLDVPKIVKTNIYPTIATLERREGELAAHGLTLADLVDGHELVLRLTETDVQPGGVS